MQQRLVLASSSPRRSQLLRTAGYLILVDPIKVSEIIDKNLNPAANARAIAYAKLNAWLVARKHMKLKSFIVIAADTVVGFSTRCLGKPQSVGEAREILSLLSGQTHSVITAVAGWNAGSDRDFDLCEQTEVEFNKLTPEDIENYLARGSFWDKAGAYGIQEVPQHFVKSIKGSLANVMGFPIESFNQCVAQHRWQLEILK